MSDDLFTGRMDVETAKDAIDSEDVSEKKLSNYFEKLWDEIGSELKISHKLQKIGKYRFLLNFVIRKAARNKNVSNIIAGMLANEIPRKQLANPLFYLKLLFN